MGEVAAYLRVSSKSQDLATQRFAIERAAETRGDSIAAWFHEKKSGKTTRNRPELAALRAAVRAGQIGRVYVYKLDRLARRARDTLAIVDEMRAASVAIVNVADPFTLDLAGPLGDFLLMILAWFAEQERNEISERIADARKRVENEGGSWGRPRRVDPGTVEKCRLLRESGKSIRIIAAALKIPRSTVSDLLSEKGHYKPPPADAAKTGAVPPLSG